MEIKVLSTAREPRQFELRVPLPFDTERQKIRHLSIFPSPKRMIRDRNGNRIAIFLSPRIGKGKTDRVVVAFQVETFRGFYPADPWADEKAKGIDARSPFSSFGRSLTEKEPTPFFKAKRIYQFCIDQIRYAPSYSPRSPGEVLRTREAQCSDLTSFFIALCRSVGISARYLGGLSLVEGKREVDELHSWAETRLPEGRVSVDPTLGRIDLAYRLQSFGELSPFYVLLWKGEGAGIAARVASRQEKEAKFQLAIRVSYQEIRPWFVVENRISWLLLVPHFARQEKHGGHVTKQLSQAERAKLESGFRSGITPPFASLSPETEDFLGVLYTDSKVFPKAIRMFLAAIQGNPSYSAPYENLSQLYAAYEEWNSVIAVVRESEKYFQDEFLEGEKGLACIKLARFPDAAAAFGKAVALAPGVGWNHCMLGIAEAKIGKSGEAVRELEIGLNQMTGIQDPVPFRLLLKKLKTKK